MVFFLVLLLYLASSQFRNTCPSSCNRIEWPIECFSQCMNPECNYGNLEYSSDAYSLLEASYCYNFCYCSKEMLTNGICDLECNNYFCAYDLGECGYCASGCFIEDLESDTCKIECLSDYCAYYDSNPCTNYCAMGCSIVDDLHLKDICKEECLGSKCIKNYIGTCHKIYCAPECSLAMRGDSKCDYPCYNSECEFDRGDCYCAKNCISKSGQCETNEEYTDPCDVEQCNYKDGKCGYCASGCYEHNLADGICQPECDTDACNFDEGDCRCDPYCNYKYDKLTSKFIKIGGDNEGCTQYCLTLNCRFGVDFCMDNISIKLAVLNFISNPYDYEFNKFETCILNGCTYDEIIIFLNEGATCDKNSLCYSNECSWCMGQTDFVEDKCLKSGFNSCLVCNSMLEGSCLDSDECPENYENIEALANVFGSDLWCLKIPTFNSKNNYDEIFIDSLVGSQGKGTKEYPYNNMFYGFAHIHDLFTKIYLLNKEIFYEVDEDIYLLVPERYNPIYTNFNASEIWIIGMYSQTEKTKVYWRSDLIIWPQTKKFFMKNIEFIGKYNMYDNCIQETCYYCPYVVYEAGYYYNDKSEIIEKSDYFQNYSKDCKNYNSTNIFYFTNQVYIEDVSFMEFRYQYNSFIKNSGILNLKNVNFTKMQAKETGSIILLECTKNCNISAFNYNQGLVNYIGAGYNNVAGVATGSFIKGLDFGNILIANVTFAYNFAFNNPKKSESAYLMYSKNHLGTIIIEDCKFDANFVNYLVYIDATSVEYNYYKVDIEIYIPITQQHFFMNNITITNTYCSYGLIKYLMKNYTQNINITNLSIKNSVVDRDGIFNFDFQGENLLTELNTYLKYFQVENHDSFSAYILPRSLILENITVTTSVTGKNVVYINNYPTSKLKNIKISRVMDGHSNGNKILEIYNIIELFSKNQETSHFFFMENENTEVNCKEMILVNELLVLFIDSLFMSEIFCLNDETSKGLSLNKNKISNIYNFSFIDVNALHANALTVDDSIETNITNLNIHNVINNYGSIVYFFSCNSIHIKSVKMSDISNYVSPIFVNNSEFFYLSNFRLSNISIRNLMGSCLLLLTGEKGSLFNIQSGYFTKCIGNDSIGGAVLIDSLENIYKTSLQMHDVTISDCYSKEGSAIYISDKVYFNELLESKLTKLLIKNSDCVVGGIISVQHYFGKLIFDELEMINNTRGVNYFYNNHNVDMEIMNSKINAQNCLTSAFYLTTPLSLISSTKPSVVLENVEILNSKYISIEVENKILLSISKTTIFNCYEGISLLGPNVCEANLLTISNCLNKCINLQDSSRFFCKNCEFTLNKNFIIKVMTNSIFNLENSKFYSNHIDSGHLIYLPPGSGKDCSLINTTISSNSLKSGSLIYLYSSILTIKDSEIIKNYGYSTEIQPIFLNSSLLKMFNSKIQFNTLVENGALLYATLSTVFLEKSVFEKSQSIMGNIYGYGSKIIIKDCKFSENTGGDIYTVETNLNISKSIFENSILSSLGSGTVKISGNNKTEIKESIFKNISTNQEYSRLANIYDELSRQLIIFNCTFIGLNDLVIAVYAKQIPSIIIKKSEFFGFDTGDFSVLTAVSFSNSHTLSIIDSFFTKNKCIKNGGGVYSESYNLIISNVEFSFNTALNSGGGIYFSSPNCDDCGLYLLGNTKFLNNSCNFDGGAIKWKDFKPFIEDSVLFSNNSAAYGPDLASTPIKFGLLQNGVVSDSLFVNLSKIPPGKKFADKIQVVILDIYNQLVLTENSLIATLMPNETEFLNFSLSGRLNFYANKGIIEVSEFILSGKQGSDANLKLKTDYFKNFFIRNVQRKFSDSVYIYIELRNCIKGEQIQASACVDCDRDKYALTPTYYCFNCPIGAKCLGGSTIIVNDGYWRSSLESDVVYVCDVFDACLQGTEANELGNCSTGYTGVLCKSCVEGYSKTVNGVCTKCPSENTNILVMLTVSIATAALSFTIVKTTLTSAFSPKSLHSIYIKILTNYLQLVFIVTQLDLEWPDYVAKFLNVQRTGSSLSDQLISLDCYLSLKNPKEIENVYYTKICIIGALPLVIVAISYTYWIFYGFFKESYNYLKREVFSTIIILFFLVYPSILKSMFSNFSCIEIDKMSSYLNQNTSIECWSVNYKKFSFLVVIPSIVLWALGFPILLLVLLTKNRRRTHLDYYRVVFGFLYNGYKQNRYYWEFLIMFRKILLITITVTRVSQSREPQALNLILVLIFSILLQHNHQPYNSSELNNMDMQALNIAAMTIYFGLYYLSQSLSDPVEILLFLFIILGNSYFILYWIYYMFGALIDIFIKIFPKYRAFFKKGDNFGEEFYVEEILKDGVFFNHLDGENSYTFLNLEKPKEKENEILKYRSMEDAYLEVAKRNIERLDNARV